MKILCKFLKVAITAVFLVQVAAVATGQDAQRQLKRRLSKPPADNSDIVLPLFSLEMKAETSTANIGEKLEVEVTLTNTDSQDIFYSSPQRDFELEVRDEMGKKVSRRVGDVMDGSRFAARLHPGQSIRRYARLDKEFELDKPGNYLVQATRGVSETNERKSNTITITIIP